MSQSDFGPGVAEVTLVAVDSTPAMRVIQHLVNTYVTASVLQRGLHSPGCIYRRLRVNTSSEQSGTSPLPEDGEPYASADGREDHGLEASHVHVQIEASTKPDAEAVQRSLLSEFTGLDTSISVWDGVKPEPHQYSLYFVVDTAAS
ncbi:hypothetical protein ACFQ6C_07645 [Streptomyces sp. NPDC056454]|uniref:hypothetical protein n=1 Tax=Streptomyces sp. NPDC056454 TaxID=3345823 RepID=UPI00367B9EC8